MLAGLPPFRVCLRSAAGQLERIRLKIVICAPDDVCAAVRAKEKAAKLHSNRPASSWITEEVTQIERKS